MHLSRLLLPLSCASLLFCASARADSGDALEAILKRSSLRSFDPARPVSDAELGQIMQAGWNAPTLDGSRPFEFVQIRDRKMLETLAGETKFARWLAKAPAAIAVLVNTKESPRLFRENGTLAFINMFYKARELGLGTCFQGTANHEAMKRSLGVGKNLHLLTIIPVGAPLPGKTGKSPPRNELEQMIWQGRIGQPPRFLDGTSPAQGSTRTLGDLLGPSRRDVTRFAETPVAPDKLRAALEAMRAAPSSKNRQPWRWVLVDDPQTKQRIAGAAKDRALAEAPVVAVLASSAAPPSIPGAPPQQKPTHHFRHQDAACALANLRLGAECQGLAVRISAFGRRGESRARAALSDGRPVSKHRLEMVAAVGIGYPGESSLVNVPPLPAARIHRERYRR